MPCNETGHNFDVSAPSRSWRSAFAEIQDVNACEHTRKIARAFYESDSTSFFKTSSRTNKRDAYDLDASFVGHVYAACMHVCVRVLRQLTQHVRQHGNCVYVCVGMCIVVHVVRERVHAF